MTDKLTMKKFQMLKLIDEISKKNEYNFAPVKTVIDTVTSKEGISSIAVRKMIWELHRDGYLESPLRGCWRLTDKARELLSEVEGE